MPYMHLSYFMLEIGWVGLGCRIAYDGKKKEKNKKFMIDSSRYILWFACVLLSSSD